MAAIAAEFEDVSEDATDQTATTSSAGDGILPHIFLRRSCTAATDATA